MLRKSENAFIHVRVTNSSAAAQAQFSTKKTLSKYETEKDAHVIRGSSFLVVSARRTKITINI